MPAFAAQHSLFRAYDIRGARQYFTSDFIDALGRAFCALYQLEPTNPRARVVIGYDTRHGSQHIADALTRVLASSVQVIRLGLITTPMMAFWAARYEGHGIMVTASHSHKDTLGIKWMHAHHSPSSEAILAMRDALMVTPQLPVAPLTELTAHIVTLPPAQVIDTYTQSLHQVLADLADARYPSAPSGIPSILSSKAATTHPVSLFDMTVVVDCMHGASGRVAAAVFQRYCRQVLLLNETPDGDFPTGNPDPTEPNRLAELQQTVILNRADMGLAFDGDADRLMVIDNSGKLVAPDHLLYLLAHIAITDRPVSQHVPKVMFDVKCAHHLSTLLLAEGAESVMSRTGSSLMRQHLQADPDCAVFAGELSGHFIFNDGYFMVYDDALYASLRLLFWLAYAPAYDPIANMPRQTLDVWGAPRTNPQRQLTDITEHLPRLVSTADHYLPMPTMHQDSCSIVEHLTSLCQYLQHDHAACATMTSAGQHADTCCCLASAKAAFDDSAAEILPKDTRICCIDGIRLDFARGFGVLRQSNTSHSLTVRFAGDSAADLHSIQARFVRLCQPFNAELAAQIATIDAT
ncbi:phosphomannomutase [Psychrobacter aestuarii]|uniref:phosphomannomutase n=1 Tax=Psychrobacter aestuarii TaxID=556327 RepID=A0ABN0W0W8_9GAMM|nr:phosphomannomutase [Psychrobacter aestuarii]